MRKRMAALVICSLFAAPALQPLPSLADSKPPAGNGWGAWVQVKKLSY